MLNSMPISRAGETVDVLLKRQDKSVPSLENISEDKISGAELKHEEIFIPTICKHLTALKL